MLCGKEAVSHQPQKYRQKVPSAAPAMGNLVGMAKIDHVRERLGKFLPGGDTNLQLVL